MQLSSTAEPDLCYQCFEPENIILECTSIVKSCDTHVKQSGVLRGKSNLGKEGRHVRTYYFYYYSSDSYSYVEASPFNFSYTFIVALNQVY